MWRFLAGLTVTAAAAYGFVYVGDLNFESDAGQIATQDCLASRYHQSEDDLTHPVDYDAIAKFVEFQYRFGRSVADADERPRWNDGDFFGDLFARN